MVRGRFMVVVVYFPMGCAAVLVAGCAGVRSGAPQEEQQGHTEATKQVQTRSPQETAAEEAECAEIQTVD